MITCDYCDSTDVRLVQEGWGSIPPLYTCEECYIAPDVGPCWDDCPRPANWTCSPADALVLLFEDFERMNGDE